MIGREKKFDESRIMEKIKIPRIKELCPKDELYLANDILYILYKSNDATYPDVGKITTRFYGRPIFEHIWGIEILNNLERFMKVNCPEKEKVIAMVEELCNLPNIDGNKIEEIFEKYIKILKPVCVLYKICYYLPISLHALDIRVYKGNPTRINRSCMMYGIVNFVKGKLTKKEAMNIWSMIQKELDPTEVLENVSCVSVPEHIRNLKDDRYHKKGDIKVDSYVKLKLKTRPL